MRRLALGVAVIGLGLAALVAAGVAWRLDLAAALIGHGLARAGFPDARFTVERVTLHDVAVVAIEAGPALRGERVEVAFDLRRLPEMPVERVRVTGARVDLSALPARGEATGGDAGSPAAGFPLGLLPVLELEDVVVTAASVIGPVSLRLDSEVSPEGQGLHMRLDGTVESEGVGATVAIEARRNETGRVTMSMDVASLRVRDPRLRIADGSATIRLDADTAGFGLERATGEASASLEGIAAGETRVAAVAATIRLDARMEGFGLVGASGEVAASLEGVVAGETEVGAIAATIPVALVRASDPDGAWTARLSKAALRLPAQGLDASAISGDVSREMIDLRIGRVADTRSPRRFEPLSVRLRVPETTPGIDFVLDVAGARGRAPLHAQGRWDPARRQARIDVTLPRLELDPEGLRLTDVSALLERAGITSGGIEGTAALRWQPDSGLTGQTKLGLHGASVDHSGVRIGGLTGTVALRRLFPPETAGTQTLRAREILPGVTLTDAALRWALEPAAGSAGSRLRIERFEAGLAGGRIVIENALLDPSAATNELEFRFEEVDVEQILALAGVEGVSGTGRLAGTIPVAVRAGAVGIDAGRLAGGTGVLRIRSQAATDLLAGGGESTGLLLDALRDFHYDELSMIVEKGFEGAASVHLHLQGRNPAVLDGHPFRINVNLSGNLDRLVGSLLEVARISDEAVRATVHAVKKEPR